MSKNKYILDFSSSFKKEYKLAKKRGYDMNLLKVVVNKLQTGELIDPKYKDHPLNGKWKEYRECHILPDWLLIYRIYEDKLILVLSRTGSHSDLF